MVPPDQRFQTHDSSRGKLSLRLVREHELMIPVCPLQGERRDRHSWMRSRVARRMTVGVIDRLEAVQVDIQHGVRASARAPRRAAL